MNALMKRISAGCAAVLLSAGCGGEAGPETTTVTVTAEPSDSQVAAPTVDATTSQAVTTTSASETTTETPTAPAFDTAARLDDLWESSDEHAGLCVLWRDGKLERSLTDGSDLEWDIDEMDEFFDEKCEAVPDGSRAKPYPRDTDLAAGDWSLRITDAQLDAWGTVEAENQFNDPPSDGYEYVLLTVEVEYEGSAEPVDPWRTFDFAVVGADGNTFTDGCGVIPKDLRDVGDMYSGASASGNVCLAVASDQVDSATVRVGPSRNNAVFVELADPEGGG